MDRGAWRATVYRVTKSQTPLKQLSTHACAALGQAPGRKAWMVMVRNLEVGQKPQ